MTIRPSTTMPPSDDATRMANDRHTARIMTDGSSVAAVVRRYLPSVNDGSTIQTLAEITQEQAVAIAGGDLSQLETMLLSQATALQAMFIDLAYRAKEQTTRDCLQTVTGLALKCASGSRQAIVALAELRMPKTVMFAKQANVTSGPQQINNGVVAQGSPARAEEIQNRPNELSGTTHELLQDTRTSCAAGVADPCVEAVGTLDRAAVTRR